MRWVAVLAFCLALAPGRAVAQPDWGVRRDPFDATVVRRYKELLARDPHDAGALRQLVAMYKRYRKVGTLEAEYREQIASKEDWAPLVVLARLTQASRTDAIALWNRALKVNPNDGRGWLAYGDLVTDAPTARDAFKRAATLATSPRDKRAALVKLVIAAKSADDPAAQDAAYGALIALAPKDGGLWLDRGNAQLAAGKLADAKDSFALAESLFKTDPERRLIAMMNQGTALDRLGHPDEAIAQYLRTLDKVPRGFYLGTDIVIRIIDTERRRHGLPNAIALLEKRWPEKARRHFEWEILGALYLEIKDDERALIAYKRAVAKAPTEIVTQRKLIALLDRLRPDEALAQHEAAARVAPGDADLQITLAKRYHDAQPAKAFATLERLSRRLKSNVNVRVTIAALYDQWDQPLRAIVEYEAVVVLEPNDLDHVIVLGDAYWRADNQDKARASWDRLSKLGTAAAHLRHGEILAMHELWVEAATAYTKSIDLDGTNPKALRGRAQAQDELGKFADAAADARRAVALVAHTTREDGERERHLLVRVLGHWHADGDKPLASALAMWRFSFKRGDNGAGYLLAAHHARIGSRQQHDILVELYRRVPADDSLGLALARSYVNRKDFDSARSTLDGIARRSAARAEAIGKLIVQLEEDRVHAELEARWEEEGASDTERKRQAASSGGPDIIGRDRRTGIRLGVGSDIRGTESAILGVGFYRTFRVAPGTAGVARIDWTGRDDPHEELSGVGVSFGITRRLVDTRKFEVAAGIASRFELRYGSSAMTSTWDRGAIAGDFTLDLVPRAMPATLGVRIQQSLTDEKRGTTLLLELGFEVR